MNSDFKADVRSLSIAVDLTRDGTLPPAGGVARQDFSLQNATTLPLNDARAFVATMKVLTAAKPLNGLWSLPLQDKLRVVRTLALARSQAGQPIKPYQQLRYWSTVPFRHGAGEVVKQSATPSPGNPSRPLQKRNPDALRDELVRHLDEDSTPSTLRFWPPVPRYPYDDLLGQAHGCEFLDRECQCRVERSPGAIPHGRAAHPDAEVAARRRETAKRPISTSPGMRLLTARPSGASIARDGPRRLPAGRRGCGSVDRPASQFGIASGSHNRLIPPCDLY